MPIKLRRVTGFRQQGGKWDAWCLHGEDGGVHRNLQVVVISHGDFPTRLLPTWSLFALLGVICMKCMT